MKATHETAMIPTGRYHFPNEKGPGTSLSRPEVMRRKIGTAYEVYNPITAALQVSLSISVATSTTNRRGKVGKVVVGDVPS